MNIRTNKRHKVNEKHQQQASSKKKIVTVYAVKTCKRDH